MTFTIRAATREDCHDLTDLCLRSKQSHGYDAAFMEACREELTVSSPTLEQNAVWLAEKDGNILGCVALGDGATKGQGEVTLFFIDPNAQKQGIGRALWRHLLDEALKQGRNSLLLHADPNAVVFYEKIGFTINSESPSLSIPGRMLPVMERKIP